MKCLAAYFLVLFVFFAVTSYVHAQAAECPACAWKNETAEAKQKINRAKITIDESAKKGADVKKIEKAKTYLSGAEKNFKDATMLYGTNAGKALELIIKSRENAELSILQTIPSPTLETRAVWLHPNYLPANEKAMRDMIRRLKEANFNLIYPLMFYHGRTFYPSKVAKEYGLPSQDEHFKGIDPLKILVDEARKNNIEVHVWYCVFFVGGEKDNPILDKYPDWAALDKDGKPVCFNGECHADPANSALREFLAELMVEAVKNYDIDGIHLDYIRYPSQFPVTSSFSSVAREKFKEEFKIDPVAIDEKDPKVTTDWDAWRMKQVTMLVDDMYRKIKKVKPAVKLSAAVFTPPFNRTMVLQEWEEWVKHSIIDFLIPMTYTPRWQDFKGTNESFAAEVSGKMPVYPGIAVYQQASPFDVIRQIQIARELGFKGVTLFAYAHLTDTLLSLLKEYPFKEPATPAF